MGDVIPVLYVVNKDLQTLYERFPLLVQLFMYFLGDGTFETECLIYISSTYRELLENYVKEVVEPLRDFVVKCYVKSYNKARSSEHRLYIRLANSLLEVFKLAYTYVKEDNVERLLELFKLLIERSNNTVELLSVYALRGFFDAEGSIHWKRGRGLEVKLSTSSRSLYQLCKFCLTNLGLRYGETLDSRRDRKLKRDYYYIRL
jgi:hypothetical protein